MFSNPIVDLSRLSARAALAEMMRQTVLNPLEAFDRAVYGEIKGIFRRYVGVHQVLVVTRIPW